MPLPTPIPPICLCFNWALKNQWCYTRDRYTYIIQHTLYISFTNNGPLIQLINDVLMQFENTFIEFTWPYIQLFDFTYIHIYQIVTLKTYTFGHTYIQLLLWKYIHTYSWPYHINTIIIRYLLVQFQLRIDFVCAWILLGLCSHFPNIIGFPFFLKVKHKVFIFG